MTTEVSDDDFQEILAQTRHFVRTAVVPREQEILAEDRVPDDLREQAKKMGLFGYAIPQEWGGLGSTSPKMSSSRWSWATRRWHCARCLAPTTASLGRCSWVSAPTNRRPAGWSRWLPAMWWPPSR